MTETQEIANAPRRKRTYTRPTTRVFQIANRGKDTFYPIRFYYKAASRPGYHVSFNTGLAISNRNHWDAKANRVFESVAGAAHLNTKLKHIYELAMDAIGEKMSQDDIRALFGIEPAKVHKHYRTRSDKGCIKVPTALRVLHENGWKKIVREPEPANEALPLFESSPEREGRELLEKYEAIHQTKQPVPAQAEPQAPASDEYWYVHSLSDHKKLSGIHWNTRKEAEEDAVKFSRLTGVPGIIWHCKPVARVQEIIHVEEL